jgi:hypothetical protein
MAMVEDTVTLGHLAATEIHRLMDHLRHRPLILRTEILPLPAAYPMVMVVVFMLQVQVVVVGYYYILVLQALLG